MGQGFGIRLNVLHRSQHQLLQPLLDGGPLALAKGGIPDCKPEFDVQHVALAADQLLVKNPLFGDLVLGNIVVKMDGGALRRALRAHQRQYIRLNRLLLSCQLYILSAGKAPE